MAAVVAATCLVTAIIISGRPATSSRPHASGTPSAAVRWTYATGSYVESSPAVAGDTVYVSSDQGYTDGTMNTGTVYALAAATGRLRWSYTAADSLESGPAVAGGTVYIGRADGTVDALRAP